jgi:hypothetical protein
MPEKKRNKKIVKTEDIEFKPSEEDQKQQQEKVEFTFPGSEVLRTKFPKSFEVLDQVATDWKKDGDFENLSLPHPMAQFIASKGLKKLKETEKKISESPTTEKVVMKAFEIGLKVQSKVQEVKSKFEDSKKKS